MKILIIIIFMIHFFNLRSQEYYYFKEKKIEIKKLNRKAYLQFSSFNFEEEKSFLLGQGWEIVKWNKKEGMHEFETLDKNKSSSTFYEVYIESKSEKKLLPKKNNIEYAEFYFEYNNSEISPTQLFYVQLKDLQDFGKLKELANKYDVEVLGFNKFMPNFYTLKVKNSVNSISISRKFYETGLFASSEPNFVYVNPFNCMNDPQFGNLWGLKNIGQNGGTNGVDIRACNAWNTTRGNQNIVVAVIDEGIELTHSDLMLNIHPLSFNAINNTSPSIVLGDHGTHCAGTIGAVGNNSIGVIGVAPNITLMSINVQWGSGVEQILANGINLAWQNGASVLSNSWGGGTPNSFVQSAISNALNNGRNGIGCVVLFSTGNSNSSVSWPANCNPDIVTVGSITRNGNRSSFSNFGEEIDIVAPGSDILSTVLNNGFGLKSGTSMACPHVSGIAALILSVNPCLPQSAVHDIICKSGQKLLSYSFVNTLLRDPQLGLWNEEVGHGLVDAAACVNMASTLYLQNKPEVNQTSYLFSKFEAGKNVDPYNDLGIYSVEPNADITLRATESVLLRDGFHAKANGNFHAKIEPNAPCHFSNPILKVSKVEKPHKVESVDAKDAPFVPTIQLYPNPTQGIVKLDFELKEYSNIQYIVSSMEGKVLFSESFNKEKGTHIYDIAHFLHVENGTYLVKICINTYCQTYKIIKNDAD